jgi:hypothetical protein
MISAAVLLAACGAPVTRTPVGGGNPAAPPSAAYRVDAAQSELKLLVYRAGPLAHLGHNHVIVSRAMSGWVDVPTAYSAASFYLALPVAEFAVDEPQERNAEGADFSTQVSDDARAGTRHNMLSAALLDADRHPEIDLRSVAVAAANGSSPEPARVSLVVTLTADVAGHASRLTVPLTLEISPARLIATGSVVVRQSALGLTPFSIMLGALQVQDEIAIRFKVVALKDQPMPRSASSSLVPSGAVSIAACACLSGAGLRPQGPIPTPVSRASVAPMSSTSKTRVGTCT